MSNPLQRNLVVSVTPGYLETFEASMIRLATKRGRLHTRAEVVREAIDRLFAAELHSGDVG